MACEHVVGVVLTKLTCVRRPCPLWAAPYPRRRVFESEHKQAREFVCICFSALGCGYKRTREFKFLLGVSDRDET